MFLLKCCFSRSPCTNMAFTGFNKKRLSSNQCTLYHNLIFLHPIWSRAHWSLAVLWHIVSSGRFIGPHSKRFCVVKTSVDDPSANAPVDNPSALQRICSVEWLFSGEPFKEPIFFWGRFRRPFISFCVLLHSRFGSHSASIEQYRVAYIESLSCLPVGHTTLYQYNRLLSLCIWQFSKCWNVEI
jgi:hypothetical protein